MLQDYLFSLPFGKLSKLRAYFLQCGICCNSVQQLAAAIEQRTEPETALEWLINHTA